MMIPGEFEHLTADYLIGIGAALCFLYGPTDQFLLCAGGCFTLLGCVFEDLSDFGKKVA